VPLSFVHCVLFAHDFLFHSFDLLLFQAPAPGPYIREMSDAGQFFTNRVLKDFKEKYAFLYYFFSLLHFFCMHLSFFTSWTQIILNWKFVIAFVDQLCGSVQLVDEWYFLSNHLVAVCTGQKWPA